jgi:hypothetical protein
MTAKQDELHAAIMNLPWKAPRDCMTATEAMGYAAGHRDARHAAAELMIAALRPEPTDGVAPAHEGQSREAHKAALMVLCAVQKMDGLHPNMQKDITFAIEATRGALGVAIPDGGQK